MAKRLSTKHRKIARRKAAEYLAGNAPRPHKIAVERSSRAKKRKANPSV